MPARQWQSAQGIWGRPHGDARAVRYGTVGGPVYAGGTMKDEGSSVERTSREVDAILRQASDWRGAALARVREIVLSAHPDLVEDVKWKKPSRPEGVPVWSLGGIVCIGEMLKSAVRLTFPKGAQLKDPKGLCNTRLDSRTVRAIDIGEGAKVSEAALRSLIREAVKLNR